MGAPFVDSSRPRAATLAGVGCVSAGLLMTELSLTRIFSVTMYYHFAFLAISIALFGLSASGVYVFLSSRRFAGVDSDRLLADQALAYGVVTILCLAHLLHMPVSPNGDQLSAGLMTATYIVAALPFFVGGAALAIAMTRFSASVNEVYAADLIGAGGACLLLMPALNRFGAPGAILIAALLGLAAAVAFASPARFRRTAAVAAAIAVAVVAGVSSSSRLFALGYAKGHTPESELFSKWNSFSRIAVYDQPLVDWSLSKRYAGPLPESRLMDIDASAATQIVRFHGDLRDVDYLKYELTAVGYRLASAPGEGFHALVIGTGGGRDVLSALVFGASSVDGVEINPIIARDVMQGRFREYSGNVYGHPAVRIHIEDGRSFVRRSADRYDFIQASLVDTWAATAAGAFTLTENSLYTVEAFDDYIDHLNERGTLSISRWIFDGLRLVSLARSSFERRGADAASRMAIIQNGRIATFLFRRNSFTDHERQAILDASRDLGFLPLYVPGVPPVHTGDTRDDYARLILARDPWPIYDTLPYDVSPTTDDRPFFFHTARLQDQPAVAAALRWMGRQPRYAGGAEAWELRGPGTLVVLLGISIGLVALFVIGPLALTSRAALRPGWLRWLTYFGCLGAAFMLIEIAMLQRFVLLLGHPVYSLTATLFALLLGTGLGSAASRRVRDDRVRRAVLLACSAIIAIAMLWATILPSVVNAAIGLPLAARVAIAVASILPAGLVMGIPLPAGVRLIRSTSQDLVPWAWGINGALSVVGATVAVFIAMNWGFSVTLLCGAAIYGTALVLATSSAQEPAAP